MKRILLVPHGQTPWNEAGRFQGHTDVGMNARGFEQARRMAESLRNEKITAIVASDLQRAVETATPVSLLHGLPLRTDARLRELHFGEWEGLTGPEVARLDPVGWQRWDTAQAAEFPGGETLTQLAQRLRSFLDDALASLSAEEPHAASAEPGVQTTGVPLRSGPSPKESALLVVAHRGALRVLISVALGLEPILFRRFFLYQTSVTELRFFPHETVLHRFNDIHHLRGMDDAG